MTDGFGQRLRRERERRHISLDAIASASKINVALFEALERGDVSRWPPGIFRRSFIRAYATGVGLDPEVVVHDFAACFPESTEPNTLQAIPDQVPPRAPTSTELRLHLAGSAPPPSGRRLVDHPVRRCIAVAFDAVVLCAIALGAYAAYGHFWISAAVSMGGYYSGGVMLFGHTPGMRAIAALVRRRGRAGLHSVVGAPEPFARERTSAAPRDSYVPTTTIAAG